jgi:hypothetical protein
MTGFDEQATAAAPAGVVTRAMANCIVDTAADTGSLPALVQALTRAGFTVAEVNTHLSAAREAALVLKGLRS